MEYEIINKNLDNFRGTAWLVEMSEEIRVELRGEVHETRYFIISTATPIHHGPETYIFAADGEGEPLSWTELPGSVKHSTDRQAAVDRLVSKIEDGKITR